MVALDRSLVHITPDSPSVNVDARAYGGLRNHRPIPGMVGLMFAGCSRVIEGHRSLPSFIARAFRLLLRQTVEDID
jgi:hypothetical protein